MHLEANTRGVPSLKDKDPGAAPKYVTGTRRRLRTYTIVETDYYMDLRQEPGQP